MTTRVVIKNMGPEELGIWFYDCEGKRTSDPEVILAVGEELDFFSHDGKRAMPYARRVLALEAEEVRRFHAIPPSTWGVLR